MSVCSPVQSLVVDDESSVRESFRNYLEDLDYQVLEAANGRVGLEIFEREQPGLILVDLRMPELDGLEVLTSISSHSPEIPLIVISGAGVITDAVEALRRGAWDYLFKPINDLFMLRQAIEKALKRASLMRDNRIYLEHLELEAVRRAEELKQTQQTLCYRSDFEKIIANLSSDFVRFKAEEVDAGIQRALQLIGEFVAVDRSHIFLLRDDHKTVDNTHEWCAQGIASQRANLQSIALDEELPWLAKRLRKLEDIQIPAVAELPASACLEQRHFEEQGLQSLVVVPMISGGTLQGTLGFAAVQARQAWPEGSIDLLKIVGEIFINTLERKGKPCFYPNHRLPG